MKQMNNFEKKLEKSKKLIERQIYRYLPKTRIANLSDGIRYSMLSGGKRIRPFLCIETCRLLNSDQKKALPFAIACEFLHNWILIHDDIEDGDVKRRNKFTIWKKFGLPHAINIGDMMAHDVFEIILNSKLEEEKILKLIKLIVKVVKETCEGQTLEINLRKIRRIDENQYVKIAKKKTGYYFACPMIGGAIIAGASKDIQDSLLQYGKNIGVAFQIVDDIIDLTLGKGRGEIGCDIREGKKTLMVLHTLKKCSSLEKKKILTILEKPRDEKKVGDILAVKKLFEKYNSIEYAHKKSMEFARKAKKSLKGLPINLGHFLEGFTDYIIQRYE